MQKKSFLTIAALLIIFSYGARAQVTGTVEVLSFIYNMTVTASASSARIEWSTRENSTSLIEYGETSAYGINTSRVASLAQHSFIIGVLNKATTYHFRITNCPSSTVCYNTTDLNVTTLAAEPTPTPQPPVTAVGGGGGTINVTVTIAPTPTPSPTPKPTPLPYFFQEFDLSDVLEEGQKVVATRTIQVRRETLSPTGYITEVTLVIKNVGDEGLSNFDFIEKIPAALGDPTQLQYSIPPTSIKGNEVTWRIAFLAPTYAVKFNYATVSEVTVTFISEYGEPVVRPLETGLPPGATPTPEVVERVTPPGELVQTFLPLAAAVAIIAAGVAIVSLSFAPLGSKAVEGLHALKTGLEKSSLEAVRREERTEEILAKVSEYRAKKLSLRARLEKAK